MLQKIIFLCLLFLVFACNDAKRPQPTPGCFAACDRLNELSCVTGKPIAKKKNVSCGDGGTCSKGICSDGTTHVECNVSCEEVCATMVSEGVLVDTQCVSTIMSCKESNACMGKKLVP